MDVNPSNERIGWELALQPDQVSGGQHFAIPKTDTVLIAMVRVNRGQLLWILLPDLLVGKFEILESRLFGGVG